MEYAHHKCNYYYHTCASNPKANFIPHLTTNPNLEIFSFDVLFFFSGPYPEPFLFINEGNSGIHAIDLLTEDKTVVIRGLRDNYGMAIDTVEMKIYFRNGTSILRTNLDGTSVEVFVPNVDVSKMAIDWIGRRLIWVRRGDGRIFVIYLHDKQRRALTEEITVFKDIAVDATVG
jgi:hypothetical protein